MQMVGAFRGSGNQRQIDRLLLIFTAITAVTYAIVLSFSVDAFQHYLHYLYLEEVFRRITYAVAILRWAGTAEYIKKNWEAGERFISGMPFDFQVIPSDQKVPLVEAYEVLSDYPYSLRCYDEELQGYVQLTEQFMDVQVGCASDTMYTGVGFLFLSIFFMWTIVKASNLYARYFPTGHWHRVAATSMVIVGLLSPVLFGVGMYVYIVRSQAQCAVNTVKDNLRRSILLIGNLLEFVSLGLSADAANLFNPSMEALNNKFIEGGTWAVSAINNYRATLELVPSIPTVPIVVVETLLERNGNVASMSTYFPEVHCFLATFPLSAYNRIIVLVEPLKGALLPMKTLYIVASFLILTVMLLLLFLYGVWKFPFDALGKVGCDEATAQERRRRGCVTWSPWEWRATPTWPWWKGIQASALLCLMIGGSVVFLDQLVSYYAAATEFNQELLALVEDHRLVHEVGTLQLFNIGSVLISGAWYVPYANILVSVTENSSTMSAVQLAIFYQSIAFSSSKEWYEGLSGAWTLSVEPLSLYPVLRNNEIQNEIAAAESNPMLPQRIVGTYRLYTKQWDLCFLLAVLTNDAPVLEAGDPTVTTWLETNAPFIGLTEDRVKALLKSTLYAGKPYRSMAAEYTDMVENPPAVDNTVMGVMNSEVGRRVIRLEDYIAGNPEDVNHDLGELFLIYTWDRFECFVIICVAVGIGGLCLLFDFYYMAAFFGLSDGPEDAKAFKSPSPSASSPSSPLSFLARKPLLPTNDHTSPSAYFSMNHTILWFSVFRAFVFLSVITVCCVVALVVCFMEAKSAIEFLIYEWESELLQNKDGTKEVFRACPVALSVANWLRALISLNVDDEKRAVQVTFQWNKELMTTFVGNPPETQNNYSERLTAMLRPISQVTTFVLQKRLSKTATATVSPEVMYKDFEFYAKQLPNYYVFEDLVQNGCIPDEDDLNSIVENMFFFFRGLIVEGKFIGEQGLSLSFDEMETMDGDRAEVILRDTLGPLLERYAGTCGLATDIVLYLQRLRVLASRTWSIPLLTTIVTQMINDEVETTKGLDVSLRRVQSKYASSTLSVSGSAIPWVTIVASFLCLPLLRLVFIQARNVFNTIYHP